MQLKFIPSDVYIWPIIRLYADLMMWYNLYSRWNEPIYKILLERGKHIPYWIIYFTLLYIGDIVDIRTDIMGGDINVQSVTTRTKSQIKKC